MAFQWYPNGKYKDLFAPSILKITVFYSLPSGGDKGVKELAV
jgi:hypothetical protein